MKRSLPSPSSYAIEGHIRWRGMERSTCVQLDGGALVEIEELAAAAAQSEGGFHIADGQMVRVQIVALPIGQITGADLGVAEPPRREMVLAAIDAATLEERREYRRKLEELDGIWGCRCSTPDQKLCIVTVIAGVRCWCKCHLEPGGAA